MSLSKKFNEWMYYNPLSSEHLALFRIAFAAFYLFSFGGIYRFDWISEFPDFFYNPPVSIGSIFNSFPPGYFFHGMNLLLPLMAIFILIGYKTNFSTFLFGILLIVNGTFLNSFGKISHSHLIPFTALIFAFSGWGLKYSVDSYLYRFKVMVPKAGKNVIPFFSLIIAFAFFTSGFSKLIGGWLDVEYQATRYMMCANAEFLDRYNLLTNFLIHHVKSKFLWEMMDYITVFIELLPIVSIFYPRTFRYALFFLATFHVLVYLILNIAFGFYPLLYLVFIVNWKTSPTIRSGISKMEKFTSDSFMNRFLFGVIVFYILYIFTLYTIDLRGDEGLSVNLIASLFLSYFLVLYFFIEKQTRTIDQ